MDLLRSSSSYAATLVEIVDRIVLPSVAMLECRKKEMERECGKLREMIGKIKNGEIKEEEEMVDFELGMRTQAPLIPLSEPPPRYQSPPTSVNWPAQSALVPSAPVLVPSPSPVPVAVSQPSAWPRPAPVDLQSLPQLPMQVRTQTLPPVNLQRPATSSASIPARQASTSTAAPKPAPPQPPPRLSVPPPSQTQQQSPAQQRKPTPPDLSTNQPGPAAPPRISVPPTTSSAIKRTDTGPQPIAQGTLAPLQQTGTLVTQSEKKEKSVLRRWTPSRA